MSVRFETFPRAEDIDRELWNHLADGAGPTMEWEYFKALEGSGSVGPDKGYQAAHLVAYSDHRPVALAPLYERDRAWVEFGDGGLIEFLTELTGIPYHRGLVGTIPFTPVPAYQFLVEQNAAPPDIDSMLLSYIDHLCETRGLLTSRIYFVAVGSSRLHSQLLKHGYVPMRSEYCLWFNRGYRSFEDYLGSLKTNRRTKVRRELRAVRDQGIDVRMLEGPEAPVSYFESIYDLYVRTWEKHMGTEIRPFLNRAFFLSLADSFRHRMSFSAAFRSSEPLALALFYHKSGSIYGRYWGCFEEVPFLHFATCYYHPIAYAIRHSIQTMDPGFGGEHKLIRGYETVPIHHYVKFHGKQERYLANSILDQMRANRLAAGPRA